VAFVKKTIIHEIWLVDLKGQVAESQFYPTIFAKSFYENFIYEGLK
jgi:hypothetical protein